MFITCERCGSNLDPNERCDCETVLTRSYKSLFTAGTRVRTLSVDDGNDTNEPHIGSLGKVAAVEEDLVAVEFDDPNYIGHNCNGAIPSGRGYWFVASDLLAI